MGWKAFWTQPPSGVRHKQSGNVGQRVVILLLLLLWIERDVIQLEIAARTWQSIECTNPLIGELQLEEIEDEIEMRDPN